MATWRQDIIRSLEDLGGQAGLAEIYRKVADVRQPALPKSWQAVIRKELEYGSSDSSNFMNKGDFFYSVEGIGNGVWGLRSLETKTPVASDTQEFSEAVGRSKTEVYRILRDTRLARYVKGLHLHHCQICGMRIELKQHGYYSEAHHVRPLGTPHNGPDIPSNIIVLCPNHHVAMDYGVDPLSLELLNSVEGHEVGAEFIDYHNEYIFGDG